MQAMREGCSAEDLHRLLICHSSSGEDIKPWFDSMLGSCQRLDPASPGSLLVRLPRGSDISGEHAGIQEGLNMSGLNMSCSIIIDCHTPFNVFEHITSSFHVFLPQSSSSGIRSRFCFSQDAHVTTPPEGTDIPRQEFTKTTTCGNWHCWVTSSHSSGPTFGAASRASPFLTEPHTGKSTPLQNICSCSPCTHLFHPKQ